MAPPTPRTDSAPPPHFELSGRQRAALGAAIGAVVAGLLLPTRSLGFVEGLEAGLVDMRTRAFVGGRPPDERIVVAEILEPDIAALKRAGRPWPWDLDVNAAAFRLMAAAGTRAVLLDVLHLDKGAGLDDALEPLENPTEEQKAIQEGEGETASEYGAAMKALGRVAIAMKLTDEPVAEIPARAAAVRERLGPAGIAPPADFRRSGADLPVKRVAEGASIVAFANVPQDADGIVRRSQCVASWGGRPALSLPLATALVASGGDLKIERDAVVVGGVRQRWMPDGSFLVNFRGPPHRTYPRLPPSQIYAWAVEMDKTKAVPEAAKKALEGKIVVWGKNVSGEPDLVASPLGIHRGPEFQASALDNLLHGDGRVRATPTVNALVLFALAILVGAAGVATKRRIVPHAVALGAIALAVGVAFATFSGGTSIDLLTPIVGIVLAWGGALAAHLLTEGRYNRWLEGTFGRYLAPEVIDALKSNPALLALGGTMRNITVLFSDVAGFTKLSEALTPEKTVTLLNEYLTHHCDAVLREAGVVDKFMGDGVMAFFGDPVPSTDHAVRACRAALAVQAALPALRPLWESMGLQEFPVRIGLNSGDAKVGNMGSRQRFSYTAMGDNVNLASRLEGANKAFGTRILLGPLTYEGAKDRVVAKPLAAVQVVGRENPVAVYELMGMREGAPPTLLAHVAAFESARDAAMAGDLDRAARSLADAARLKPGDGPCEWFGHVLEKLRSGEEPSPWSGVYVLTSKG